MWKSIEEHRGEEVILFYPAETDKYGKNLLGIWITIGRNNAPRKATHFMHLPESPHD